MPADGVLTTIDLEVEHQRAAKEAFVEEGVKPTRTRTISGRALDVLPRLTDGGYDLVFVDADKETPGYVEQAVRLLRPGGVLAVDNALWHDRVADPARRDEPTTTIREVGRIVRGDDRLLPPCCPSATGCWWPSGAEPVRTEELAQLRRVQLGLLERREVPAAGGSVARTTFAVRSSQARGGRTMSPAKIEKPDGTSTRRACCAGGIAALARYIRIEDPIVPVNQ